MGREDKQYPPMDWFETPKATFEDRQNHISWVSEDRAGKDGGVENGGASYAISLDSQFKGKLIDLDLITK